MKTLYLFAIMLLLSAGAATAQVQFRGMYIDDFDDILGNSNKEDSLLQYAQDSSFNYLALYDLHTFNLQNVNTANQMATFIKRARDVFNITYVGAVGESYSSFNNNIGPYNMNRADDHEKFNVFNLEFEFWTTSSVNPGGYYCNQYLIQNNCSCDTSGGFKFFIEQMHKIDSLAAVQQVISETYLGWFNQGQGSQIANNVDRILLHAYRTGTSSLFSYSTTRLSYLASNNATVEVAPIFSSEPVFMGPWLETHSQAEAFTKYETDFNNNNSAWKQYINIIGYHWFTWEFMRKPEPAPGPFAPVITMNTTGTLCTGDTATLTATLGDTYNWSNGATTRSITSGSSGTFSCDVTLNGTTLTTPAVMLTQRTSPTVDITAGTTLTNIVPLTANAVAGSGNISYYQWKINSAFISGATTSTYNATNSGNYTVTVYDTYGCQATSAQYAVAIPGSCFAATPTGLNSTQGIDISQVLTWDPISSDSIIIRYHPDSTSTHEYISLLNTGQTSYVLNNLHPGVLYSWRLKTVCGTTQGTYSAKSYFTTPTTVSTKPDLISEGFINVYPNPARSKAHVSYSSNTSGKGEITLTDISGRIVMKQTVQMILGENNFNVLLSEYKNGVYTIAIKKDNAIHNQKLIIDN